MTKTNRKLKGIPRIGLNMLRRLDNGSKVYRPKGWGNGNIAHAFDEMAAKGFVTRCQTPKGRRQWYELTEAGRALLPAVREYFARVNAERDEELSRMQREDAIRDAAPDMLALVQRVAKLNPDAGEIGEGMLRRIVSEARAILAEIPGAPDGD